MPRTIVAIEDGLLSGLVWYCAPEAGLRDEAVGSHRGGRIGCARANQMPGFGSPMAPAGLREFTGHVPLVNVSSLPVRELRKAVDLRTTQESASGAVEFSRSALDGFAGVLEDLASPRDLFIDQLPLFLLDAFPHARQGLHPVAGIKARSVDLVFIPGAVGQPIAKRECAFDSDQFGIGIE